jgi:hypothetical protein
MVQKQTRRFQNRRDGNTTIRNQQNENTAYRSQTLLAELSQKRRTSSVLDSMESILLENDTLCEDNNRLNTENKDIRIEIKDIRIEINFLREGKANLNKGTEDMKTLIISLHKYNMRLKNEVKALKKHINWDRKLRE